MYMYNGYQRRRRGVLLSTRLCVVLAFRTKHNGQNFTKLFDDDVVQATEQMS